MFWYEVPVLVGAEGGVTVLWDGVSQPNPPGSVFHVLKTGATSGLLGTVDAQVLRDGWVECDLPTAQAVFERFYGKAPSTKEVYEEPAAKENTVAATSARLSVENAEKAAKEKG